jgi:hypothetical protein
MLNYLLMSARPAVTLRQIEATNRRAILGGNMMKMRLLSAAIGIACATPALALQTPITINLINSGGVEQGTDAFYGYRAAADYWQSVLTTSAPISINLQVGFLKLDPGVLGSTGSNFTIAAIADVQDRLIRGQTSAFDAIATGGLPTLYDGQLGAGTAVQVYTPGYTDPAAATGIDNSYKVYDTDGSFNNSVIGLTTANAKALGYDFGPDPIIDAEINFSSEFDFDFDPKNGIRDNSYDFIGVAIHEIGHALGFVSGVDDYDVLGTGGPAAGEQCFADGTLCQDYPANDDWFGETLDLFRYSADGKLDWTTGTKSYFSIDGGKTAFKDGYFSTGAYNGDGSQASHWIDNQYAPRTNPACSNVVTPGIGIMNPTLGNCEEAVVTALDLAAFDAIGYNTPVDVRSNYAVSTGQIAAVPEPATWMMMIGGFALAGAALRRRTRVRVRFA